MTDPTPPDFAPLRERGIRAAQDASGAIWTDYNLHDPGVTLLEQTCFALTEIGYRNAHPVRDLLTGPDDTLDHDAAGLFDPARMLPTAPVTEQDLAAAITESDRIARAVVLRSGHKGLYEVRVIPEPDPNDPDPDAADAAALAEATRIFRENRPLCCDLDAVRVSRRRPVRLTGEVAITPTVAPERVAAEILYRVGALLRGQADPAGDDRGATRAEVYDRPERFLQAPARQGPDAPTLDTHLAALRRVPGVAQVGALALRDVAAGPSPPERDSYRDLVLPAPGDPPGLVLTLDGVPLALDPDRVREEHVRVATEHMARAHHHLDARDWAVRRDGRRRGFDRPPVDALLPMIYRAPGAAPALGPRRAATVPAPDLSAYRAGIDGHLAVMTASLATLPELFADAIGRDTDDPAERRRRIEVLDHLIALQGEEMPATRHTGLHHYRSRAERERAEIDRRIAFLRALPDANFARGTAPHGASAGGFLAKLALLADLRVAQGGDLAGPMAALGLALDPDACAPDPALDRADLPASADPMALLVPRNPAAPPLVGEALLIASPFVAEGRIASALFARAADPAAYLVAPDGAGGHRVLFDPGEGQGLFDCGQRRRRAEADHLANRLRNGWRALHENCEGVYLVEDILLRGRSQGFDPHAATLVLTGWTARTARPDYRAHVEALVERLAPAHVLVRPLWLGLDQMARVEAAHAALRRAPTAGGGLRAELGLAADRTRLDRAAARLDALDLIREAQA
ncbi:MAG: hypothetical protein ACP5EN_12070 [Rhodovulum sp.]